jgi:hypothetical protein
MTYGVGGQGLFWDSHTNVADFYPVNGSLSNLRSLQTQYLVIRLESY